MALYHKYFLLLVLTGYSSFISLAQNVYLNSQTDVNIFDNALTSISGNLIINSTDIDDPIVDLSNLSNLTAIGGNLQMSSNHSLVSVDGLDNLSSIGGYLQIDNHNALANIDGFTSLSSIGSHLELRDTDALLDVDGFINLLSIDGYLLIERNAELLNLDGLLNVGSIAGNLRISYNPELMHLDGLSNLTSIDGQLRITYNTTLTNLDGLANLTSVGAYIIVEENPAIVHVDGFIGLTAVAEYLRIASNPALSNVEGLANLTSISGNFDVHNNDALSNLSGLSNLITIGGNLEINDNSVLTNLDGLVNLISVGGALDIYDNESLTDCCAIQELLATTDAIGGLASIYNNPSECSSVQEVLSVCPHMNIAINVPCIGVANGSIQVQIVEAFAPFIYHWQRTEDGQTANGTSDNPNFIIENLAAGTYDLTITDAVGNEFVETGIVLLPLPGFVFEIIEITTTNSSNGADNGAIHLVVAGGTPPYSLSWSGVSAGSQAGIADPFFTIPSLLQGEYEITVFDDAGNQQTVVLFLLDETVPALPCTRPLDIVILNDVSGSVDAVEYNESKQFFVDFLDAVNIGPGPEDSRAAIIEWSGSSEQSVQIPMTGNWPTLQSYVNFSRAFDEGTNPHEALSFGGNYLASVARPDVARILVLSTDGSDGQISPSLISLADQYKAAGYHIVTIAFGEAFTDDYTRDILQQVASVDLLAPGASAYAQLDQNLAQNIVELYLCPLDPGSSATVYFNRDGAIEIIDLTINGDCPNPENVVITFTIEALRELSIPSGMPVTFYYNDPALFGASAILTWYVPCAIPVGTIETFMVNLPVTETAHVFAVLNDDGSHSTPIAFPITTIDELAYSNNISDTTICDAALPTLQALKSTATPIPICNNIVMYTIDVCNVTDFDAFSVLVDDIAPAEFVLLSSVINDNGCATDNGNAFDIPGGCCVSIIYTYDASNAPNGNYEDQDVLLTGPDNQVYLDFDGATTSAEDVVIDGTIDCSSTVVNFLKEVNVTEICEDAFVVYTFTIDNQLDVPLQALLLTDIVPAPVSWVFQPYNLNGLSISNSTFEDGNATFIIDEVAANTIAHFSIDAALGDWTEDGILNNSASLENVPDLENGGIQTLVSNVVTTNVSAIPEIEINQMFDCTDYTVTLSAALNGQSSTAWLWQTTGDGTFSDVGAASTVYTMSEEELGEGQAILTVSANADCGEINETVEVTGIVPEAVLVNLEACEGETIDYNGTNLTAGDMQEFIFQNSDGCDSLVRVTVETLSISSEELIFTSCEGEAIDYDGTILFPGESQVFTFQNSNGCDSLVTVSVTDGAAIAENLTLESCAGETIDYNGVSLSVGDSQEFVFQNSNGCDSIVRVLVTALPTSNEELVLESCTGELVEYHGSMLTVGEHYRFTFENSSGCDSTIMVSVQENEDVKAIGFPNIFSPNRDGINDCLQPYFSNDIVFRSYKFSIYNRWGGLVFSTNDLYACWDGKVNNKPAETGVYVWFLELATDACESLSIQKGDVMLIR